jgi:hypothetical protein
LLRPSCKASALQWKRGTGESPFSLSGQTPEESPVPPGNLGRSSIEAVLQFCGSAFHPQR